MPVECSDPRVASIVAQFESLSPASVDNLNRTYDQAVSFKDPFNDVQGLQAVQGVFRHMFQALLEPRFLVRQVVVQGNDCFMTWDFLFRFKSRPKETQTIHGATHLKLNTQGLITHHRDYWDAAEELYEKIPLLGGLMRWLKKKSRS